MKLANKIRQYESSRVVDKFKADHPEAYAWFNSVKFMESFLEKKYLRLRATYRSEVFSWKPEPSLPFSYKGKEIPLDLIEEYLEAEGFTVKVSAAYARVTYLEIYY